MRRSRQQRARSIAAGAQAVRPAPAAAAAAPIAALAAASRAILRRAELHAVVLALMTAGAQAADTPALGRLFNTPQQRAQLDAQRQSGPASAAPQAMQAAQAAPVAPPSMPTAPPSQVLNGIVQPAGGQATVWLNQEPLPEDRRRLARNGKITVTLPSGQRVTLKPGQRYDETTGEVRDDVE